MSERSQVSAWSTISREIVVPGPPAELGANAVGLRHDGGRIAGAAGRERDLEIDARDRLHDVDHLEHRVAAAVAAIERQAAAAAAQMVEGDEMGVGEVADLDVVAHAGAVGGRIIGAEHLDVRAVAERRLGGDLDEMGGVRPSIGPERPRGSAPGDVEIAQDDVSEVVGAGGVLRASTPSSAWSGRRAIDRVERQVLRDRDDVAGSP